MLNSNIFTFQMEALQSDNDIAREEIASLKGLIYNTYYTQIYRNIYLKF